MSALGRIATPASLLTIARHGMKPNPLLGDTRARLSTLSQHDLSFDEQTVDILVNAIREDLPTKLLGRVLPSRNPPPLRLIESLSSTRAEKVETLFSDIAEKFRITRSDARPPRRCTTSRARPPRPRARQPPRRSRAISISSACCRCCSRSRISRRRA
jgi:hypothetical protein